MTHATKIFIANGLRSILSMLCAFLTFSVLNGVFYLAIFFSDGHDVLERGLFVRYEVLIAFVTAFFAIISGWVLARIAPFRPTRHAWILGGIITLYIAVIASQQAATPSDVFFVWLQIVPGIVCGAFLCERHSVKKM
ncbi:MAG: hypothetical protein AAB473_05110 [Patescibacteria group bacterium]